jgi:hypothetical protein
LKLYENWLPPDSEDAQTALVFGALRHVPVEHGLQAWLSGVLGRQVRATPLEVDDFWPRLPSIVNGSTATEPELVFEVDDGQPLLVVIENKPGYGGHTVEQLSREAVDAAHAHGARRLALIMVGADIGPAVDRDAWQETIAEALAHYGLSEVDFELHYSSWAAIGRVLQHCAAKAPTWARYIEDAVAQLRFRALLGYDGAPMFDDLDDLTVPNVVEAFNRTIKAGRQFFLTLHGQPRFAALKLRGIGEKGRFAISRDGRSISPEVDEHWFTTHVVFSAYRREHWPDGLAAFVAVDLYGDDETAMLCAGAVQANKPRLDLLYELVEADESDEAVGSLRILDMKLFGYAAEGPASHWVYDERPWTPGSSDADVAWAVDHITAAVAALDGARR